MSVTGTPPVTTATSGGAVPAIIQVPMPFARAPGAPRFEGMEVRSFLTTLIQHGVNAGITNVDDLVPYIIQYSSDDVRNLIRYMPEFDAEVSGKTWQAAKDQLLLLYGHAERVPDYSEAMLKDFCEKSWSKSSFASVTDVGLYYRGFSQIAVPLIKKGKISKEVRDFYFVAGIPKHIKEWFLMQVPEAKRKRSNPPSISESIAILQKRFDDDALGFSPWLEPTDSDDLSLSTSPQANAPASTNTTIAPDNRTPATNSMDELARQLERLHLQIAAIQPGAGQGTAPPLDSNLSRRDDRKCFMCGKVNTHQIGLRNCPDTRELLDGNLIRYDTNQSRYVQHDGSDLPRTPAGFIGGVADYMRALVRDRAAATTARTSAMGLTYGSTQLLGGNNFAVTSLDLVNHADPVTRSGKDTGVRFDPVKRPEKPKVNAPRDPPPHMPRPPTPPAKTKAPQNPVPVPPNPINRQDGWKGSLPSTSKPKEDPDVVMRDAKKLGPNDKYHITSALQERADAKTVFEDLLKTPVTIPLLDVIGLSPQLQKIFADSTRSKREYSGKLAEYSFESVEADPVDATVSHGLASMRVHADASPEEIEDFIVRYGNAIAKVPEGRYFAMSTGTLSIRIGDVELTAMIDTGSELNLTSRSVPARCGLAVDFEGMKWALKGIHGAPEQLRGCATDVAIRIGGHSFPHHVFVSHQELGNYDMILGQPFLQWFAARLDYERQGGVSLYLWKSGERKVPPTIVVTITDPDDTRNTTSMTRSHVATIEEVDDEEDF